MAFQLRQDPKISTSETPMYQTAMAALTTEHLTLRLGNRDILHDVTLEISVGERVAIVGPNGSGKTTLLRALAGLLQPKRGKIWIDGVLATPANIGPKSRIGYVGHDPHLYPHLTARENLLFIARLFEIPERHTRVEVTLEVIGLAADADHLVREFSRGMQQRLTLGAAMLHTPLVLLLDEPNTGLDTDGAKALPTMIETLAPNTAVLFSTHDEQLAIQLASRIIPVRGKKLVIPHQTRTRPTTSSPLNHPPGTPFSRAVAALITKDARLEWRTREQIPTLLIFALLTAFVFDMALIAVSDSEAGTVATGVLWTSMLLAATLGGTRLFAIEHDRGTLDRLRLLPIDPSTIYVAKFVLLTIEISFVGVAQLVFLSAIMQVSLFKVATLGLVALAASAISAVVTLQSSLIVNARARELLMPLLAIPLTIPIMLACVGATLSILDITPAAQQSQWLGLLGVTTAVFFSLGVVLYPHTAR